jgi:predicted Zn-dependent protease
MKIKPGRILLYTLVAAVLLLGGGYAGWRAYKSARQARLVKQARDYLADSEPRKALLCLQRALSHNNRDVEACRLMAQLVQTNNILAAMLWRGRVVELNPRSLDDRLALVQTALNVRDYVTATNTLAGVDEADKKTAAYHNIAGAVAAAAKQPAQAESHFLEATRLEPRNAVVQLNLAVVRLAGTNASALADARSALKTISVNPTNSALRCQALRELAVDAMRQKQPQTALALSGQLLQETNAVFRDRLLRLEILHETRSADFKSTLAGFQNEASTNAGSVFELGTWQLAKLGPAETLAWLRTLPQTTQTNLPVPLLLADCQGLLKDWRGLQALLEEQNWGVLEFLRYALKARALRGQELTGAAKAEWELALKAANNQKEALRRLLMLTAQWNWESEAEEILWNIVNRYPDERWAVQTLSKALIDGGRTRPLLSLFSQELKRAPADLANKNNVAMTALLLEANELKPYEMAREVYEKSPTNAAYASTYAFALHLQGKNADALKIMQTLTPAQLEDPSIAGYYGLILKATGESEKAKAYLNWAFKAPMLPEERKLFERARAG